MKRKLLYALLLTLALVMVVCFPVSADANAPDCTDTPQPPATETRLPPPTETSMPPSISTPPGEVTPSKPLSEPTPTIEVDPTPTETLAPGVTPERHKKPTPVETLPVTGGGMPANVSLGLTGIGAVICVFVIFLARRGRNGNI